MICPSCGCESKREVFCDLCGEPFAKKLVESPSPAPKPSASDGKVRISPEVMQKLFEAGAKCDPPPRSGPVDIPPEFRGLDTGGQIGEIPPAARKLAWVMLAVVMAWIVGMTVWLFTHQDRIAAALK
ncbi:MAG: hypothetical protein AUJ52_01365 [Elusimicrobia bacterium CG1_02_63_36]|nr:MAG: hypothetical protein AUJ52_01365 [Elusimicrobia bacterium CG1_02_63_36]